MLYEKPNLERMQSEVQMKLFCKCQKILFFQIPATLWMKLICGLLNDCNCQTNYYYVYYKMESCNHPPTTKSAKAVLCASHVNVAISLDVASE